eukprot:6139955-Pyramimonas_sp.AAC.1
MGRPTHRARLQLAAPAVMAEDCGDAKMLKYGALLKEAPRIFGCWGEGNKDKMIVQVQGKSGMEE